MRINRLIITGIILSVVAFFCIRAINSLMPTRQLTYENHCTSHLQYLAQATRMYAGDHGGNYPSATNWCDLLCNPMGHSNSFVCPAGRAHHSNYAFNSKLSGKNESEVNPRTVMFFDSNLGWNAYGGPTDMAANRHGKVVIVCFADGSVEYVLNTNLNSLRWNP